MSKLLWTVILGLCGWVSLFASNGPVINLEYYGLPTCHDCIEFRGGTLEDLRRDFASQGITLAISDYDILDPQSFKRLKTRLAKLKLEFTGVPLVLSDDRAFQGNDLDPQYLRQSLGQATVQSRDPGLEPSKNNLDVGAIVLAGLIDGINPCAFSTLLFLISVLGLDSQSRQRANTRRRLGIGLGFSAGVFCAYSLMGLGLWQVVRLGSTLPWLGQGIRVLTLIGLLTLAILSLRDWWQIRRGKVHEISLRLPNFLQTRIHSLIRSMRKISVGLIVSFGLGSVVSKTPGPH